MTRVLSLLATLMLLGPGAAGTTLATPIAPIAAVSAEGQALLWRSGDRSDYAPLAQEFITQANLAYCGVASAVMVLNSLGIPAPAAAGYGAYRFWTQENFFDNLATRAVLPPETVARQGMTLDQLTALLGSHGLQAERSYASDLSLEQFRQRVRGNLRQPGDRLLVNYYRPAVGQQGGGHISPLAAYDERSDRILLLDVARYRYPSVWIRTEDLWQAARAVDSSSGRSRGLVSIRPATR